MTYSKFIQTLTSLGYKSYSKDKIITYFYEEVSIIFIIDKDVFAAKSGAIRSPISSEIDTVNIVDNSKDGLKETSTDECVKYIIDNKHYDQQLYRENKLKVLLSD